MGNSLVGDGAIDRMPLLARGPSLEAASRKTHQNIRPEFRQEHPLNLSISISGGEETNQDSPSSGERTGKSPT